MRPCLDCFEDNSDVTSTACVILKLYGIHFELNIKPLRFAVFVLVVAASGEQLINYSHF